jgi:hypothetical protein
MKEFSVISFRSSVRPKAGYAQRRAAVTGKTDFLSQGSSWFLDLFGQAKEHPFDFSDPRVQCCIPPSGRYLNRIYLKLNTENCKLVLGFVC